MNLFDSLYGFLGYVVAFVPMLGILVFVHELGHFAMAKLFGVRVLKFSLGFGSPIGIGRHRLRWERGGTEYVVAWVPLGGFVKMLGEPLHGGDDEEEVPDAAPEDYLNSKPTWQKLAISFAGPAMNMVFPVVIFVALLAMGLPKESSVIGLVEPESPAARAGLQVGDRLIAIDGDPVEWWAQVAHTLRNNAGATLALRVERAGGVFETELSIDARPGFDEFGGKATVGWIGIGHRRLPALIGVPDGGSWAAAAGLRSGDLIAQVAGVEVPDWEALRQAYETHPSGSGEVELRLQRGRDSDSDLVDVAVPATGSLEGLGLVPATILVDQVSEASPAEAAGLQRGDLILAVDAAPVGSFNTFADIVQSSEGRALQITYARRGETATVQIAPEERLVPGPFDIEGMEQKTYLIGITHALATLQGATEIDRERNPLISIPRAVDRTLAVTAVYLRGLAKLATGEIGTKALTGPIGIAEIARESLRISWLAYVQMMVMISINLAIVNLLPIPILDGGQALIYLLEGVKRSPISLRTREIVQTVGLSMVLMLMGLAFWNDLSRHWNNFVEWLTPGL